MLYDSLTLGPEIYASLALTIVGASACIELPPTVRERVPVQNDGGGQGGDGGSAGSGGLGGEGGEGGEGGDDPLPICGAGQADGCASIVELSPGSEHACILASDGFVRCWGSNLSLQIGDPTLMQLSGYAPTLVRGLRNVDQLDAGSAFHTCALADQEVFCWGANDKGQLGNGTTIDSAVPTKVPLPPVVELSTGRRTTCALTTEPRVYCWGQLFNGQHWNGTEFTTMPVMVDGLNGMVVGTLEAGSSHGCALSEDQTDLRCWGNNVAGLLGNGNEMDSAEATPVSATLVTPVRHVQIKSEHVCAVGGTTPELQCWGEFSTWFGSSFLEPQAVPGIGPLGYVDVAVGWRHVCLLDDTKSVSCFGFSNYGELGPLGGNGEFMGEPVVVLPEVARLAGGWQNNCALLESGEVRCWGRNQGGQSSPGDSNTEIRTPASIEFDD